MSDDISSPGSFPISFEVSTYLDCVDELIRFRNQNRETTRDRSYFDWRYQQRPCRFGSIVVWAISDGRKIGALSIFPHDYFVADGEYPLGVLGDISVLPECRGRGIARKMFDYLPQVPQLRQLYGGMVLPNDDAARPLAKSGWAETSRVYRYVKILDARPFAQRRLGRALGAVTGACINPMLNGLSVGYLISLRGCRFETVDVIDERFDVLWRSADHRGKAIGVRDRRYLKWRYETHPLARYRACLLLRAEAPCGYVMYSVQDGVCEIVDVFCVATRHVKPLLAGFLKDLRRREAIVSAVVNVNDSFLKLPWRWFGFVRRADHQKLMTASWGAGKGLTAASWHVMAGDKDV